MDESVRLIYLVRPHPHTASHNEVSWNFRSDCNGSSSSNAAATRLSYAKTSSRRQMPHIDLI